LTAQREANREISDFVRDAAWFNVFLVIGAITGIAASFLYAPFLLCLLAPALPIYAILQTVAVLRARAYSVKPPLRHHVITICGMCFVALPLITVVAGSIGGGQNVVLATCVVLFPSVGVLSWAAGDQYAALCMTSELGNLQQWCRGTGRFNAIAVALIEMGFVSRLVTMTFPISGGAVLVLGTPLPVFVQGVFAIGGFSLLLAGATATAALQFVLARRLRHLAKKAGPINLTGPALPTSPSPTS
jgi:hypothetical protein